MNYFNKRAYNCIYMYKLREYRLEPSTNDVNPIPLTLTTFVYFRRREPYQDICETKLTPI